MFLVCSFSQIVAQTNSVPEAFQNAPMSTTVDGTGGDPGDPYCDPLCNCRKDGSICPIDSGVYFLLAIGAIYGIKKVKDTKLVREVK